MKQESKDANIKIRTLIKDRCLSREEVATALGVHVSTVSHLLSKELPKARQQEIIRILRQTKHDFTRKGDKA